LELDQLNLQFEQRTQVWNQMKNGEIDNIVNNINIQCENTITSNNNNWQNQLDEKLTCINQLRELLRVKTVTTHETTTQTENCNCLSETEYNEHINKINQYIDEIQIQKKQQKEQQENLTQLIEEIREKNDQIMDLTNKIDQEGNNDDQLTKDQVTNESDTNESDYNSVMIIEQQNNENQCQRCNNINGECYDCECKNIQQCNKCQKWLCEQCYNSIYEHGCVKVYCKNKETNFCNEFRLRGCETCKEYYCMNCIGFNKTHKCVTNASEIVPFSNEILIFATENKRSAEGSIDEQKDIKRPKKWRNFNDKVQIRLNQMNTTLKKLIKK